MLIVRSMLITGNSRFPLALQTKSCAQTLITRFTFICGVSMFITGALIFTFATFTCNNFLSVSDCSLSTFGSAWLFNPRSKLEMSFFVIVLVGTDFLFPYRTSDILHCFFHGCMFVIPYHHTFMTSHLTDLLLLNFLIIHSYSSSGSQAVIGEFSLESSSITEFCDHFGESVETQWLIQIPNCRIWWMS